MKKYELTDETRVWEGRTLHRIRALIELELDTGDTVKPGDLGGWIQSELNLAQESNAWIADEAIVCDSARCFESALVFDHAIVSGEAQVFGKAWVCDNAQCYGHADISGTAWIHDNARVYERSSVSGSVWVRGDSEVCGFAVISGDVKINSAFVCGHTEIHDTKDIV
jgi:carbonic anhydrase/acetyltransferase-like protein (isoleucine patch superfamily)